MVASKYIGCPENRVQLATKLLCNYLLNSCPIYPNKLFPILKYNNKYRDVSNNSILFSRHDTSQGFGINVFF